MEDGDCCDAQAFDKNRDGYIDEHELRQTMHELGMKLSAEDVSAMMSQAGCRITGRVYYEGYLLPFLSPSPATPSFMTLYCLLSYLLFVND